MRALTNSEIIAALPEETRQKINNSFESLSQASPSPEEQAILYRVAHTLKLQPTDTIFSIMSALHFYLQLYNVIPGKIKLASVDADEKIRKATSDTLIKHAEALKAQTALLVAQTQDGLTNEVGRIAQQIAGNAAAATAAQAKVEAARWQAGALAVGVLVGGIAAAVLTTGFFKIKLANAESTVSTIENGAAAATAAAVNAATEKLNNELVSVRAAAGWAATEAGIQVSNCKLPGWRVDSYTNGSSLCITKDAQKNLIGKNEEAVWFWMKAPAPEKRKK